jgi:hypothetical protein
VKLCLFTKKPSGLNISVGVAAYQFVDSIKLSFEQTGGLRINVTSSSVRVTTVAVRKPELQKYYDCVSVMLVIQHAKRMCRIVLSFVAVP